MTKTGFAVTLLFALCSAAACSDQHHLGSESIASSKAAIQGGATDTGHPFAVGLCLVPTQVGTPDSTICNTPNNVGICSGALIAPNLIVTARHCILGTDKEIDCATSVFGSAFNSEIFATTDSDFGSATHWHQVAKINMPTPTAVCGNDIALLTLADNVPTSEVPQLVTPIIQYPMTDYTLYSLRETAIGFGATEADTTSPPGAGTRRILQNIQIGCEANDPATANACAGLFDASPADTIITPNEFYSGDGTCEGDSGSSAYEQKNFNSGGYYSFGVLSRGGDNTMSGGHMCIGSIYTRLDAWRDLIISTVTTAAAAGGYPIPSWTQPAPVVPDAGPKPVPGTGQLGDGCTSDGDCASLMCRGQLCTQTCDDTNTCPDGFDCNNSSLCEATVSTDDAGAALGSTTTTTSCGCKLAGGPNNPVPWKTSTAIALGALVLVRRRASTKKHKSIC